MTDVEKIFRRDYLFSKGDMLQSLELIMDYIENDPGIGYTEALIKNKLALYRKLYQKVEMSVFPN